MRAIRFLSDFQGHHAGNVAEVDDQLACDAIAQGHAVPSIDPVTPKAIESAPENKAIESAPEVK